MYAGHAMAQAGEGCPTQPAWLGEPQVGPMQPAFHAWAPPALACCAPRVRVTVTGRRSPSSASSRVRKYSDLRPGQAGRVAAFCASGVHSVPCRACALAATWMQPQQGSLQGRLHATSCVHA